MSHGCRGHSRWPAWSSRASADARSAQRGEGIQGPPRPPPGSQPAASTLPGLAVVLLLRVEGCAVSSWAWSKQMEAVSLAVYVLGPLLLPLLAVLLMALCVRCRELPDAESPILHHPLPSSPSFPASRALSSPGSYDTAVSDSLTPSSIMIKLPPTLVPRPSATPYPLQSQPDLLPIPSPQPLGGSHRMASSRQDSDSANSVASYENEGVTGTPVAPAGRRLRPVLGSTDPVSLPPEAACEDADEDDDDYNNEGYLVVLPDRDPATSTGNAVSPAPASSKPGLRDSAFSMESGEDYVNVPESEESANASLNGSREYVNVSQELQPGAKTKPDTQNSQEVEDEEAPDYENL
ncbi:linker for activation of T-cells family member 1 isoform X2 [Cervus elaphus]|uniref:linker for activation of T-cells family member 1 isoform X2 n=1 Tax=Cervus elaphus TaxID=9860 RepID=UPI001CC2A147|nr:linker for activation of T-cells family member 1 isoform X2 [Cervus elaphus]